MTLEQWNSTINPGDIVRRDLLLNEIKTNLVSVIRDYEGLGVNNEQQLILQTNQLFTGDIIPSREDWESLNEILRELSTVKEQGQMYERFIEDVSDSLGVEDLEKIKDFIDYIQTLPPMRSGASISLRAPVMYRIARMTTQNINDWEFADISWALSDDYLQVQPGTITIETSESEDVDHYEIEVTAGNFSQTYTRNRTNADSLSIELDLDWLSWFSTNQLNDVYLDVKVDVVDRRGNRTTMNRQAKFPSSVTIPQGLQRYELEYRRDNGNWTRITNTTSTSHRFPVPRINGNYEWRVRALDRSGLHTPWFSDGRRFIRFVPDPPPAPTVQVSTGVREAIVTWNAVPRADYYEVWHGGERWARDNTRGNNTYWGRVEANQTRRFRSFAMNEGRQYTWYVRAVNEGGSNIGSRTATMKRRVRRTVTFNKIGQRVWRGSYVRINRNRTRRSHAADWRTPDRIWQGAWQDADWGGGRWYIRGGGAYGAYGGQKWGNHASFLFYNYRNMRNVLRGKDIQKVSLSFTRQNSIHGHQRATPLYLYNHNRENNSTVNIDMFRRNRARVTRNNQQAIASAVFNRGQTRTISNQGTIDLIRNIVNGHMKGLGLVKYYGPNFNSNPIVADPAYMIFNNNISIRVEYFEEV